MPSKSIFILCIALIVLPNTLLATSAQEDEANATLYKKLFYQTNFLREIQNGKDFAHPNDPNKVVRIHIFNRTSETKETVNIKNEQLAFKKLIDRGNQLGNSIPITQQLFRVLNFQFDETYGGVSLEMDRYRGTLYDGIKNDTVLRASLLDFNKRLQLYMNLAFIFQQMAAVNMKHCNIEIDRVLYKKPGDDFSTMPLVETDSDFNFVLTDFMYAKDLDSPCVAGIVATWDQEDAKGNIPMSSKCKGKIEIFGLAMLILKIETILLMMNVDGTFLVRDQKMRDALQWTPDSPSDIYRFFNTKKTIVKTNSFDILAKIWAWVENATADPDSLIDSDFVLSGIDLLPNLAYIEKINSVVFEQRDLKRYPDLGFKSLTMEKVMGNYAALNNLLQTMLQPNDYVNGRPDATFVLSALTKIQEGYVANIQSLARDRILLV